MTMTSSSEAIIMVAIDTIETEGTQTRANLRPAAIEDYAAKIGAGETMDPCVLFQDEQVVWLAAGYHRRQAYLHVGRTEMPCIANKGSKADAIKFGITDNLKHRGERLSREDKRHNILLILGESPGLSDTAIGKLCGVSDKTVAKIREEREASSEIPKTTARIGHDGRRRETKNIGARSQKKRSNDGRQAETELDSTSGAKENADTQPAKDGDGTGISVAQQTPEVMGEGESGPTQQELKTCCKECVKKLAKFQDQMVSLYRLAEQMGQDEARQSKADYKACGQHSHELGLALTPWVKRLGFDNIGTKS